MSVWCITLYHMGLCGALHYTIWGDVVHCIIPYGAMCLASHLGLHLSLDASSADAPQRFLEACFQVSQLLLGSPLQGSPLELRYSLSRLSQLPIGFVLGVLMLPSLCLHLCHNHRNSSSFFLAIWATCLA